MEGAVRRRGGGRRGGEGDKKREIGRRRGDGEKEETSPNPRVAQPICDWCLNRLWAQCSTALRTDKPSQQSVHCSYPPSVCGGAHDGLYSGTAACSASYW